MLRGQWLGVVKGTNEGMASLNIEARSFPLVRLAYADYDSRKVSFHATVHLEINDDEFKGKMEDFLVFDYENNILAPWKILSQTYNYDPEACPKTGFIQGKFIGHNNGIDAFIGKWTTDIRTAGDFNFSRSRLDQGIVNAVENITWDRYKTMWNDADGFIYRGQKAADPLKTSLHRIGRYDLVKYDAENVPEVRHHINASSNYCYKLPDPEDYAALLGLAQHHGYPHHF